MAHSKRRPRDRDKIATLVRIFRSAVTSGDQVLRDATAAELAEYGIELGDTFSACQRQADGTTAPGSSVGGGTHE
ncbi:hypothetical protein Q31b_40600 [Novipirellula aureliae]|uniref:Uncharacterized protein n=1 Tax=Novipirellula aureliae TaxID=2527966 RepID=A0A5C6DQR8_9BACT|nr:hypothetical protein [Novipirellula aureliae]TWU38982.1 hypothetical protein Q31b_40600 [Novipirellula aureliae]